MTPREFGGPSSEELVGKSEQYEDKMGKFGGKDKEVFIHMDANRENELADLEDFSELEITTSSGRSLGRGIEGKYKGNEISFDEDAKKYLLNGEDVGEDKGGLILEKLMSKVSHRKFVEEQADKFGEIADKTKKSSQTKLTAEQILKEL